MLGYGTEQGAPMPSDDDLTGDLGYVQDPATGDTAQSHADIGVLQKIAEIPRRSASSEVGFDGVGVTILNLRNDGSPVEIVEGPPAPPPGDTFHYGSMIVRMANEYDTTFANV